jgi:hypothetical protein
MSDPPESPGEPGIGNRGPDVAVAAVLLAIGIMVVADSVRVGIGWAEDGPRSGYFPFYIGLILSVSSAWILLQRLLRWRGADGRFASYGELRLVAAMAVPLAIYLALIAPLGIYVPSALLIGYFMWRHGKFHPAITVPVAIGVPLLLFFVFERWFLVPLPKGPLERALGL